MKKIASKENLKELLLTIKEWVSGKLGTIEQKVDDSTVFVKGEKSKSAVLKGGYCRATGDYGVAIGSGTTAGFESFASGHGSIAGASMSHAEGYMTRALGFCSHVEGNVTIANGEYSHAEGSNTITNNSVEHAEGRYNVSHTGSSLSTRTLSSVGNGTDDNRRNAQEIMGNGDHYIYGVGGYDGKTIGGNVKTLQNVISTLEQAKQILANDILAEQGRAEGVEAELSSRIDTIIQGRNVRDIVANKTELDAYDTSTLGDNDIVMVLLDASKSDHTTYYRWKLTEQEWEFIGGLAFTYTKTEIDNKFANLHIVLPVFDENSSQEVLAQVDSMVRSAGADASFKVAIPIDDMSGNVTVTYVRTNPANLYIGVFADDRSVLYHITRTTTTPREYTCEVITKEFALKDEGGSSIFWCVCGVTTYEEISAAREQDLLPVLKLDNYRFYLQGGGNGSVYTFRTVYSHAEGYEVTVDSNNNWVLSSFTLQDTFWKENGDTLSDSTQYYPSSHTVKKYVDDNMNNLFEKGSGENSIVQKTRSGAENIAISESSVALGSLNTAGTKAYKWSTINFDTKTITLVDTPSGIERFDYLSIVNKNHYDDCCRVVSVSGKDIVVNSLPFTTIEPDTGEDAKTLFVVSKPNVGNIDLGQCAFAEGGNTMATQMFSHAEGYGTKAIGQYSHAEGRDTKAVYAAHAEGQGTEALGTRSHAEGYNTKASGNHSHAEGNRTRAGVEDAPPEDTTATDGVFAHAEGNSTLAKGSASHAEGAATQALSRASHAEGRHTVASGNYAHAEGFYTQTSNIAEHAEGRYNVSHQASTTLGDKGNTTHSVGIGTSDTNRKNAYEIMQNGDIYVLGIGGYDGTNAGQSGIKTLQDILKIIPTLS